MINFGNNGAQDLLVVQSEKSQFEVPYVDELIEQLDFAEKKIVMNLPEGIEQAE